MAHRFISLCLLISLLAGCSLWGDNTAQNEVQSITIYTSLEANEIDAYLPDFALAYPDIEVNLVREPAGGLTQRILAEQGDPQADVLWGVPLTNLIFFEWNEMLKPYAPFGIERVDRHFRDARQPPYWVGNNVMITAFCVNSRLLVRNGLPVPHTWKDLLDPIYRRSIVMAAPTTSGTGLMALLSILRIYDEIDGWQYLDALHKNVAFYTLSGSQPCQLVEQGEYPIGIAKHYDGLNKVEFIYPSEGLGWEMNASALVRKRTIQPAARLFLDWAISDSAMRLYARKSPVTAVKTGLAIPSGFPTVSVGHLFVARKKDIPWTAANRDRILTEWQNRYQSKTKEQLE